MGDAKLTLQSLRSKLAGRRKADPAIAKRIADARTRHQADMDTMLEQSREKGILRPEQLMYELQDFLTPESIVTADASYSSLWATCYLRTEKPGTRILAPRGLAGLGWGYPFALGARLARPGAPVFSVVGDGGFAHVWSELETAVRTKTPVILTVLNNGILGYQKHAENTKFGRHTTACYFEPVDHAAVAAACGVKGVRVETIEQYRAAVEDAVRNNHSVVIDAMVDPAAFPPVTVFDQLESGE